MSKRKGRIRYAPEFRRQMVELVRAGRTPEELADASSSPQRTRSGNGSSSWTRTRDARGWANERGAD